MNIWPVPDIVSGSRHFLPVTRNSCRSSVYDILLKFENLPVIVTGRKRILSVTHEIVPGSDRWPAVISCTGYVISIGSYQIYARITFPSFSEHEKKVSNIFSLFFCSHQYSCDFAFLIGNDMLICENNRLLLIFLFLAYVLTSRIPIKSK